jgi:hypothetical protein
MLCSGWTTRWQSSAKETTSILKSKGWYEATVTLPTYQSTYNSYTLVLMTDPLFADPLHWWHDNHDVDRVQQRRPFHDRPLFYQVTSPACNASNPGIQQGQQTTSGDVVRHRASIIWCCAARTALQHRAQLAATLTMTHTHADVDIISC